MFDFVRNNQRLMQALLMVLIIPSFALGGIEAWQRFKESPQDLVHVNGKPIVQQELDANVQQEMERMRAVMGSQFDQKAFDTPAIRQKVLDGIVQRRVLLGEVANENLWASPAELQRAILAIPQVAALRKADGSFDVDAYQKLLKAQNLTAEQFEASLRTDLALQSLPNTIFQTSVSSLSTGERLLAIRAQEREVQAIEFKTTDYASKVNPTAEQLQAYYKANPKAFEVPEQAKVEYVVLSAEQVANSVQVSEDDLKKAYEQNIARFKADEQRRASHILLAVSKDAAAKDREAAKAKAEQLLAEVKKNPASFADVAKKNSQDPGSAEKGGDLGFFGKGSMVKPFEDAVYGLKTGEISNLVTSDFGYHIIQLTDVKAAETKSFAAVRAELEPEVKRQLANRKFSEQSETFTNVVYEQADSLKPAVDKLKLPLQTAEGVTRTGVKGQPEGFPLNNPKLLKALFEADAIKGKRNTQAIPVNGNTLVAARITQYSPATTQPFDVVQAQVKAAVVAEQAAQLAKKEADDKLAALQKANSDAGFGAAKVVSRTALQGLAPNAVEAIMKANVQKLPAFVQADLGVGYAVYRINKVQQPQNVDAARRQAEMQQLARAAAEREFMAFYEAVKARSKVKVIRAPASANAADDAEKAKGEKKS